MNTNVLAKRILSTRGHLEAVVGARGGATKYLSWVVLQQTICFQKIAWCNTFFY